MTKDTDSPGPTVIGEHYVVDRELGRGGMATVYLCTDRRDGSRVAVKVLRHELESAVVVERFLREISFASELDHPRIPKVLDSGLIGELPYYAMTYIEGESLKTRLEREKQLPVADALQIICDVIGPTAYAHEHGIVHRDIKPDNIVIGTDGSVYVLDFGIARAIVESGVDRLTSTGIGVGTPAYMSPEQALGDRNLDARSDIYSLGCVLYEMIAGMPPFVGPTAQVIISRRFAAAPAPIREMREGIPDSIEAAVSRALARSPADRWPTVNAFGDALFACTSEFAVQRTKHLRSRRRSVTRIGLGALAVAIVAGGILAWSLQYRGAFEKGQKALQSWDFGSAETQLRRAVAADAADASARLWLAQVQMLRGQPQSVWGPHLVAARDRREELIGNDRLRADALAALGSGNVEQGCRRLSEVVAAESRRSTNDFTSALALADCVSADTTVLPDKQSKSGYRFRTSYQLADSIYEGLLERYASTPAAYAVIMPRLANILSMDKSDYRHGATPGAGGESFLALPKMAAETLAYIPYKIGGGPWRTRDPAAIQAALERNRQRLLSLAQAWSLAAPDEPRAHEMLAAVFQAMGDLSGTENSALVELGKARRLAVQGPGSSAERYVAQLKLGIDQVRLYLRLSEFDHAGSLADSLLSISLPESDQATRDKIVYGLAPLAALRGRPLQVIALYLKATPRYPVLLPNGQVTMLPRAIVPDAIALDGYAESGGSGDSVLTLAARLSEQIAALVPAAQAAPLQNGALIRPLTLAAPVVGPGPVSKLEPSLDPFVLALRAYAARDIPRTRRFLDSLSDLHADYAPGEITMDVVYGESWLRAQIGDTAAASAALDRALRGLPAALPSILASTAVAFSLGRVMALRAELAAAKQQGTLAATWAKALLQLWGRGDAVTAPTLERMKKLQ